MRGGTSTADDPDWRKERMSRMEGKGKKIAVIFPGVLPSIFLAFVPTATTFFVLLYTATTLGSLIITPESFA